VWWVFRGDWWNVRILMVKMMRGWVSVHKMGTFQCPVFRVFLTRIRDSHRGNALENSVNAIVSWMVKKSYNYYYVK